MHLTDICDLNCSRCLIVVCTTEGNVKVYRPPFCDFCAEWVEVCPMEFVCPVKLEMMANVVAFRKPGTQLLEATANQNF